MSQQPAIPPTPPASSPSSSSPSSSSSLAVSSNDECTWQMLRVKFCVLLSSLVPSYVQSIFAYSLSWLTGRAALNSDNKSDSDKGATIVADQNQQVEKQAARIPLSVNYHFTRACNYKCGFCFHTAKTSFVLPIEEAKKGLKLLKEAGMQKINFSGGEPFLVKKGRFLGEMVRYCKVDLQLPSVSIVSNGSLITEEWFQEFGEHLDILAVSCDSFNEETNRAIGRHAPRQHHLDKLFAIREWCEQYSVAFKINSVLNTHNWEEDMSESISELRPCRWKVFQCLLIGGENCGEDSLRKAESFVITDEQFQDFLHRHRHVECLVPESNAAMRDSYLILDEYMRFLDCTGGRKDPSASILDVGVSNAIDFSGFDEAMFKKRGGVYKWSKKEIFDW